MIVSLYLWSILCVLFADFVSADVQVVSPTKGTTYDSSNSKISFTLSWMDDNAFPTIDDVTQYTFMLCGGKNSDIKCPYEIATGVAPSAITTSSGKYSYAVSFASSVVGDGQYFVQVTAIIGTEGQTIHYSPRFNLEDMTGTTSYTYTDSTQPVGQTQITTGTATTDAGDTSASFSIPYTEQTGKTRYAPMQMQPDTTVTKTTWSRRFATSAVTYYSTFNTVLDCYSTVTPGWNYTMTSGANYATPAPFPSANGGWYDPKSKLSLSLRKLNAKRK
ncbi:hypothetical protein KAFR_0F01730 [Kazachstania africana CBS 2517]|uniref:Uncharacterized protein n=1 Tax=Kazachstania africana (strain ATCC 22294 / BCRC 22015 / CBS 2517 / CECT 1963 / NBRC 1671 / NRRL Y-8276) TaxID=1071382 RepID=H2AWM0_KAZAF|nr:hypothetical protein KAFR_0F01730 [Kazachstania africana CBS 2517]CCF58770.1 hypothetical protein KAFR_0F01730 [Kazachstania africana CBS 2517]